MTIYSFIGLFFLLIAGHFLADLAFQSDFMATNKNRHAQPKGYNPSLHGPITTFWPYVLIGHGAIHGLLVSLLSGFIFLGIIEMILHSIIDFAKCERWISLHVDQWLHFACKAIYVFFIYIYYVNRGVVAI